MNEPAQILCFPAPMTKRCRVCEAVLPVEQFYPVKSNRDGKHSACNKCRLAIKRREYFAGPRYAAVIKRRAEVAANLAIGRKRCIRCGEIRGLDDFYSRKTKKDGKRSECKECSNRENMTGYNRNKTAMCARAKAYGKANRGKIADRRRAARVADPIAAKERYRRIGLRALHKMTEPDYQKMLAEQGGRCAICGGSEPGTNAGKNFCVDHDHATGNIRGLLCMTCNFGLGHFKDNPELLRLAIGYLNRHHPHQHKH